MAKLTGKKKAEFLRRMARGRKKAAKKNPRKKAATKKRATKKKKSAKLTGRAKAEFLKRMAKGRKKAARKNPKRKAPRKSAKHQVRSHVNSGKKKARKKNARPTHRKVSNSALKRGAHKARRANKARSGRKNPDSMRQALRKYEEFHQRPAGHVLSVDERERYREIFADMGKLKELRVYLDRANPDFPITHFSDALAVCTPEGTNIYFIGGDQRLNLEAFGISSDKDFVEIGPCTFIMYDTVKGIHNFERTNYYHHFGEEDGVYPVLGYDRLNHSLFLIGGNYQVRPEGIVN